MYRYLSSAFCSQTPSEVSNKTINILRLQKVKMMETHSATNVLGFAALTHNGNWNCEEVVGWLIVDTFLYIIEKETDIVNVILA
jgi:hypothetical protein